MESYHSSTRPIHEKENIVSWANSVQWTKLTILGKSKGLETDLEGTVEFKAFFKENGKKRCIHEHSRFVREFGNWTYLGIV